jgi:hypothetical protein
MKNSWLHPPRQLTVAELCEALDNGLLPARMDEGEYVISHRDLARLAEALTPKIPVLSRPVASLAAKAG